MLLAIKNRFLNPKTFFLKGAIWMRPVHAAQSCEMTNSSLASFEAGFEHTLPAEMKYNVAFSVFELST